MTATGSGRQPILRALSLVVVVVWHWGFTILELTPTSISPNSPIGSTWGMWALTWILQVMPVFFFVGGYTHRLAFDDYEKGASRRFLKKRVSRLLPPALALVALWLGIGVLVEASFDPDWTWSAVILVLSPLWFLIVYLILVGLAPLAIRAHWKWGELVIVWLVGLAAVFDVLRFTQGRGWAAWLNFIVIWGLAHQIGFFYHRLTDAPRRVGWMFFWGGMFALIAITNMGFYPRSVVGVPEDRFSNMGPPTLAIVGLIVLQVGAVILLKDRVTAKLETSASWNRLFGWVNANALPLYLMHGTGMAAALGVIYWSAGYLPPAEPNLEWWLTRPLWIAAPALCTYPFLLAFNRLTARRTAPSSATTELAAQ
jgi:peptidoglycan/LPS O-acetylase OafA/YrhL